MICKLEWAKARESDQELLPNSDAAREKSNKLKKPVQKKGRFKRLNKMIQSVKENNNTRAKLIRELKEEAHRTVKEIMTAKSTDRENKLNDDDNLKNPTPILKGSKGKPEFTRPAISTQSSLCIQTQFTNLTSTVKPSPSTPSHSRLSIPFYQNSATLISTPKYKNADMLQLKLKCHTTEVSEKNRVIQGLEIKLTEKQDELTVIKKKIKKTEQKIKHYSKHWSEKTIEYLAEIHDLKSRIKEMQKLHDKNKTRTAAKDIMKNLICLNCSSLIILINILKLVNNSKSVTDFADSFNHTCQNIITIYQLASQFLLPCYERENWVPPDNPTDIKMMISTHHEASNIFLWPFETRTDMTVFFNKNTTTEKNEDLEKKNEEVDFEVLDK